MKEIIVVGAAGIDNVVSVNHFPSPEDKIRTINSLICGGGNAGNSAVAISRLGHPCALISKVGTDLHGDMILSELRREGVNVQGCISSSSTQSAFTYVIVDISANTRTCLHTPMSEELTCSETESISSRIDLSNTIIHFDTRHTEAAASLAAQTAHETGVVVSVDLEKWRPFLDMLLPWAHIIFTNLKCTDEFFPEG